MNAKKLKKLLDQACKYESAYTQEEFRMEFNPTVVKGLYDLIEQLGDALIVSDGYMEHLNIYKDHVPAAIKAYRKFGGTK